LFSRGIDKEDDWKLEFRRCGRGQESSNAVLAIDDIRKRGRACES
jgi:hypothetical protein